MQILALHFFTLPFREPYGSDMSCDWLLEHPYGRLYIDGILVGREYMAIWHYARVTSAAWW